MQILGLKCVLKINTDLDTLHHTSLGFVGKSSTFARMKERPTITHSSPMPQYIK